MRTRVPCPVCRSGFIPTEPFHTGSEVVCRVCGARLTILSVDPEVVCGKVPQEPIDEITDRVNTFARLKGYVFDDNRGLVMEGLLQKWEAYGDFFCPCRFDNVLDNICPCLETRRSRVKKEGQCRCGLFIAVESQQEQGS